MVEVGGEVGREMKERRRKWGRSPFIDLVPFTLGFPDQNCRFLFCRRDSLATKPSRPHFSDPSQKAIVRQAISRKVACVEYAFFTACIYT